VKIVFVITGLATGGAETMLLRLLERIDRTTFSPHVISLTSIGEIGPRIAALGIPVEVLGMRPGRPDPIRFLRLVRRLWQIKPDVAHTWMYHADLLGGLAAKMAMVPAVVWCVRSSDFLHADTGWSTRLVLSLCARLSSWLPNVVLYNSQRGAAFHKARGYTAPHSIVVPNGIDLEKFRPDEQARLDVRRELGVSSTTPLIGLIGRYDPLKNHEGFIQAAIRLHRSMPDVHFLMAGKDVDWSNQALKMLLEDNNLADYCHLLGPRSDIPRITAALDLATLASRSEAFPNVLIEAMACGVPCVSTDAGDAALILGEDGWIVPVGDMVGLAAQWSAFLRLRDDERRFYAEKVRRRVIDLFEIGVVVRRYEAIYQDAMTWQHANN
jgi:glycosyltransferase involved in cell wall biosynthesis